MGEKLGNVVPVQRWNLATRQVRYLRWKELPSDSVFLALVGNGQRRLARSLHRWLYTWFAALSHTAYGSRIVQAVSPLLEGWRNITETLAVKRKAFTENATPSQKRSVVIGTVGGVHLFFVLLLIAGLQLRHYANSTEIVMTLSGPLGLPTDTSKLPKFVEPDLPTAEPPLFVSEETFQANVDGAQGSPNVTIPAEAIADSHNFPPLPSTLAVLGPKLIRLTLSITESGSVSEATILQSSGSNELDEFAVNWVKARWRYRPALRNGTAIAVTTTAVVLINHV